MSITRDQILAAKLQRQTVPVPEWGGDVCINELDGLARAQFEALCAGHEQDLGGGRIMERLLACTMTDEDGNRIFSPTEADVEVLSTTSSAILLRLFRVAAEINKIGAAAVEAEKGNS